MNPESTSDGSLPQGAPDAPAAGDDEVSRRLQDGAAAILELEAISHAVSHDLREPLQAIEGFSRALLAHHAEQLDGQGRHYLERIHAGALRLAQLIDAIVQLRRVSSADLHVQPIDLAPRAREIVARLREREPSPERQVEIAPRLPAHGDSRLVAVLLESLLDNAWKFTARTARPRIEVGESVDEHGRRVFYVSDNGTGFDMRYRDKLFTAFQRLHSDREFPGVGAGLAIVHRIVMRHGGTVSATSEPGVDTTVRFTLSP